MDLRKSAALFAGAVIILTACNAATSSGARLRRGRRPRWRARQAQPTSRSRS